MKAKYYSIIAAIVSVLVISGCESAKETQYYEIPKSEVVDVPSAKKENSTPKKDSADTQKQETPDKYFTYTNERFGFSVDIPDYLKPGEPEEEDDGLYFVTPSGDTYASVYGSYNPSIYYDYPDIDEIYTEELAEMEYTPKFTEKNGNSFEIAWDEYNTAYRKKYYLKSDGTDNVLIISYPISKEKEYEEDVKHILNSFKTGYGYDSDVRE